MTLLHLKGSQTNTNFTSAKGKGNEASRGNKMLNDLLLDEKLRYVVCLSVCFPPLSLSDPEHRSVNALRMTLATDGLGYRSE